MLSGKLCRAKHICLPEVQLACMCPAACSLTPPSACRPDNSLPDRSPVVAYHAFKHNVCASLAAMHNLARIDLTECKAPYYKTAHLLASLPPSVTEVVLDRAVEGLKRVDLEVLQQLPKLRALSVSGCNIRDKHAGVLGGLRGLQTLVLRDNGLGPEGLAEVLQGCSQLTVLDVTGNERLGDRGGYACCVASVRHTSANQHLQLVRG